MLYTPYHTLPTLYKLLPNSVQRGLCYIHIYTYTYMDLYLITSSDYCILNRLWYYTQYQGLSIPMYRTRISRSDTGWVIELDPSSKQSSLLLLQFGEHLTSIKPFYLYC